MFDTSGLHFLCGDFGDLPVLVVGSTLQQIKDAKGVTKNQKLTSKNCKFTKINANTSRQNYSLFEM